MLVLTANGYVKINILSPHKPSKQFVIREAYKKELAEFLASPYEFRSLEYDMTLRNFPLESMVG